MPVEIRTCDGRHFARPVIQNHQKLPLIRLETPATRWRRRWRGFGHVCVLVFGVISVIAVNYLLKGL